LQRSELPTDLRGRRAKERVIRVSAAAAALTPRSPFSFASDKYGRGKVKRMAMADHNGPEEQADDHWQVRDDEDTGEAQRTRAATMLEQIACQVREALRAEDIGMAVFFVIPNSGQALSVSALPAIPPTTNGSA
jgi:hypothetical protein